MVMGDGLYAVNGGGKGAFANFLALTTHRVGCVMQFSQFSILRSPPLHGNAQLVPPKSMHEECVILRVFQRIPCPHQALGHILSWNQLDLLYLVAMTHSGSVRQ